MENTLVDPVEDGRADEDYDYANAYWWLHKTLMVLTEDSAKQCELMEYDHVAWTIRDDASAWTQPVLELPGAGLSDEQRAAIGRLLSEVASISDDVAMVPNLKEEHLRAMNNSIWVPIRAHAKQLIPLLQDETKRVEGILWPPKA